MRGNRVMVLLVTAMSAWGWGRAAGATVCTVPSAGHPSIQAAIDDGGCSEIVVATGTFAEDPIIGRDLQLQGAGSDETFLEGRLEVTAGEVQLVGLHVSDAGEALSVHDGAEVAGLDLIAVSGLTSSTVFADGFETGDTSAWSATTP